MALLLLLLRRGEQSRIPGGGEEDVVAVGTWRMYPGRVIVVHVWLGEVESESMRYSLLCALFVVVVVL